MSLLNTNMKRSRIHNDDGVYEHPPAKRKVACQTYDLLMQLLESLSGGGDDDILRTDDVAMTVGVVQSILERRPYFLGRQRAALLDSLLVVQNRGILIPYMDAYMALDAWDRAVENTQSMEVSMTKGIRQLMLLFGRTQQISAPTKAAHVISNIHASVHKYEIHIRQQHEAAFIQNINRGFLYKQIGKDILVDLIIISTELLQHVPTDHTAYHSAMKLVLCIAHKFVEYSNGICKLENNIAFQGHLELLWQCISPAPTILPDQDNADIFISVQRDRLVNSSMDVLQSISPQQWEHCKTMDVMFQGESAYGDGVLREWLGCLAHEVFYNSSIFRPLENNPALLHPVKCATPSERRMFHLAGQIIGMSIRFDIPIGVHLSATAIKLMGVSLLRSGVRLADLAEVEPEIHRSCIAILSCETEEAFQKMGLDHGFTSVLGQELFPGGFKVPITHGNREEYVSLLATEVVMRSSCSAAQMALGIKRILHTGNFNALVMDVLTTMPPKMFNSLVGGMLPDQIIPLNEWKQSVDFEGCCGLTEAKLKKAAAAFLGALQDMRSEEQKRLLRFWTGLHSLPAERLSGLEQKLKVVVHPSADEGRLPRAQTCIMLLTIFVTDDDRNVTRENMLKKLNLASTAGIVMEDEEPHMEEDEDVEEDEDIDTVIERILRQSVN